MRGLLRRLTGASVQRSVVMDPILYSLETRQPLPELAPPAEQPEPVREAA